MHSPHFVITLTRIQYNMYHNKATRHEGALIVTAIQLRILRQIIQIALPDSIPSKDTLDKRDMPVL